ncbi:uncharacterized protein HKW66_Vig0129650 [Vigna angularis]|uniref:Disease resistance protein At4g27190-like leucine-rich repeats domain-containing protein n=1 Tax=Phaseolus angularis TaxID=3914 RepID=A0A8T0K2D3_PHAAN|nr:uncharacterized protein HKW66_Vig0129650 [Vigna angularis]
MPNLENLRLSNIGSYRKMWDEKWRVPFFSENLKYLIEDEYHNHTESLFSSSTARELTKLKLLDIQSCPALVQIFVQQEKVTFPNLGTLLINDMSGLRTIWNNLPVVVAKELQQLQVLEISRSINIENIVVKSQSGGALGKHQNKSHPFFKKFEENTDDDAVFMKVKENKDDDAIEVVFIKLKELYLENLPKLRIFCKESDNFNFPALEKVHVIGCPKMKTFCPGILITPSLSNVRIGRREEDLRWHDDLNTTLKIFHMELQSNTDERRESSDSEEKPANLATSREELKTVMLLLRKELKHRKIEKGEQ